MTFTTDPQRLNPQTRGTRPSAQRGSLTPTIRQNDPLQIFMRLKASVSGADRLNSSTALAAEGGSSKAQPSGPPTATKTMRSKHAQDDDAMDADQERVVARPAPRAAPAGHRLGPSRSLPNLNNSDTGLEARLASMSIRKVKPLPRRVDPTTPKKKKAGLVFIPPPDAPKKARIAPSSDTAATTIPRDKDVLPTLPRRSILKRKASEIEKSGAQFKKVRIVDEPVVKSPGASRLNLGRGRGVPMSPSRYAAAAVRRRKSGGGAQEQGVDGLHMIVE